MTASRLPVSADLSAPAGFPALPAVHAIVDIARRPVYARRRGKDGFSSRFRTSRKRRAEKENLILKVIKVE